MRFVLFSLSLSSLLSSYLLGNGVVMRTGLTG